MARYRILEYEGVRYGLRPSETVQELAAKLGNYREWETSWGQLKLQRKSEVKASYLISVPHTGLVDRSTIRRRHRGRDYVCGTSEFLPRRLGEPEVPRPRYGQHSGKRGGQRSATHNRFHLKYVSDRTTPEHCILCQYGTREGLRVLEERQGEERQKALFNAEEDQVLRQTRYLPALLRECFDEPHSCREFIERWKSATDDVKRRYIRIGIVRERRCQERKATIAQERERIREQQRLSSASAIEL